ncbi:MAG TPA: metallophosphoesterase [Pyrodictium sp.]|nr:metallophosphoesterase [Pyrodictium sp.]
MATIVAVADVHSPKYLMHYMSALNRRREECREADLVVWAGDMVYRGRVEALQAVIDVTFKICGEKRIVAVFGNEEYIGLEDKFVKNYPQIIWLNDSTTVLELENGEKIGIFGTRGALERPTQWQRKHHPELWQVYRERPRILEEQVKRLKEEASKVIVVSHYAPTFKTIVGEPQRIWPELGSRLMEAAILRSKPTLVIHGHAHKAKVLAARLNGIPVYNVSLPAKNDVTILKV